MEAAACWTLPGEMNDNFKIIFALKIFFRNSSLLILPFLFIIGLNESLRKEGSFGSASRMNSNEKSIGKCTWYCHQHTAYCKQHHVKMPARFLRMSDPMYFGLMEVLSQGGQGNFHSYMFFNILFLVAGIPLMIWFFLIQAMRYKAKSRELRNSSPA